MYIDENSKVISYLTLFIKKIDGAAWLIVCILCLFCMADVLLEIGIFPIRNADKPNKALGLLFFTPIILFFVLVRLRQMPFSGSFLMGVARAVICIYLFLKINF